MDSVVEALTEVCGATTRVYEVMKSLDAAMHDLGLKVEALDSKYGELLARERDVT